MLQLIFALILAGNGALYDDPGADRLIREAMDSTYGLRLEQARNAARGLQTRFPDHPAGYTIMAETFGGKRSRIPGMKTSKTRTIAPRRPPSRTWLGPTGFCR